MGAGGVAASLFLAPFTGGASLLLGAAAAAGGAVGVVDTVEVCNELGNLNNGKGSTIKLINEMSESNGKLGEKDD